MKGVLFLNGHFVNVCTVCPLIMIEWGVQECECMCVCSGGISECQNSSRVIDHTHYSKPRVNVCYDNTVVIPM